MAEELVTSATPRPMPAAVTPRVGIVREVNCVGVSQSPLAQGLDQRFPENAEAYRQEFERGRVEPGQLFVFDPTSKPLNTVSSSSVNAATKFGKPKQVGDPCRTCGRPLERRETKKSNPNSAYYFAWYLYCDHCQKLYHVDQAKVYRR